MIMMKSYSTFMRYLLFCISLVVIPLIILTFVFYHSYNVNTIAKVSALIRTNLMHTNHVVDANLDNLMSIANLLLSKEEVAQYMYLEELDDVSYLQVIYPVMKQLQEQLQTNRMIHSIYVYNRNRQEFLTNRGRYSKDDFFDQEIAKLIDEKYRLSISTETRPVSRFNTITRTPDNILSILINRSDVTGAIIASVIVNIREAELHDYIKNIKLHTFDSVFILDNQGRLVTHSDKNLLYSTIKYETYIQEIINNPIRDSSFFANVNGIHSLVTYVAGNNGWKYVSVAAHKDIVQEARDLTTIIVWWSGIIMLFGILLSFVASKRLYSPVNRLVDKVKRLFMSENSRAFTGNDFYILESSFYHMHQEADELKGKLQTHMPIVLERFLNDLIEGQVVDETEFVNRIELLGIPMKTDNFVILLLQINRYTEFLSTYSHRDLNLLHYGVANIVSEISNESTNGYMLVRKRNEYCILLNDPATDSMQQFKQKSLSIAEKIHHYVKNYVRYPITISLGEPVPSFFEITRSYQQANDAMEYKLTFGFDRVIPYWELEVVNTWEDYYPIDKEKKLLSYMKAGQMEQVETVMQQFMMELSSKSFHKIQRSLSLLFNAVLRTIFEFDITTEDQRLGEANLWNAFYSLETMEQKKEFLLDVCKQVHVLVSDKRNNRSRETIQRALQYIQEHLHVDLSLDYIAEAVNLSPTYFAKLFKDHTNTTFVEYVTKMRMEKAAEMFREGKVDKIADVYSQLGYNSQQYFTQVFKRYYGVTPTQYRQQHRRNS